MIQHFSYLWHFVKCDATHGQNHSQIVMKNMTSGLETNERIFKFTLDFSYRFNSVDIGGNAGIEHYLN